MSVQLLRNISARIPALNALRKRRYEQSFRRGYGQFRGVYSSFEAARRSAPTNRHVGHNWADYASHHLDRMDQVQAYDYPVLFWLGRILVESPRILDFGGNVGVHYHAYSRYLAYSADIRWTVCELPELVKLGERLARERGTKNLVFTSDFAQAADSDVLIAAGVLQYVEQPLGARLAELRRVPRHLLLNKIPLYDLTTFITLQNGPVYSPQYVWNRSEFLADLERLGYAVIDSWSVPGFSCHVPFYPGLDVPVYTGLYLRQKSGG